VFNLTDCLRVRHLCRSSFQKSAELPQPVRSPYPDLSFDLSSFAQYGRFGYGNWTWGSPLPLMPRTDIMAKNYSRPSPPRKAKLINFFTFSDIHITDTEAPNQLIHFQQAERFAYNNTSIYSRVRPTTS
jgi:hypothetical protein